MSTPEELDEFKHYVTLQLATQLADLEDLVKEACRAWKAGKSLDGPLAKLNFYFAMRGIEIEEDDE